MQWLTLLSTISLWIIYAVDGSRILAMLPTPGESHHRMFQPILKALSEAGHHVTYYSPFSMFEHPVPNITEVKIDNVMKLEEDEIKLLIMDMKSWPYRDCYSGNYVGTYAIFALTQTPQFQRLLTSKEKYDLVIIEPSSSEFLTILGHIFNAPIIGVQAFMTNDILNSVSGNSLSLSFLPDICTPHSDHMGFAERFVNVYNSLRRLYIHYYHHLPALEERVRRSFPDMPHLMEMYRNVSLTFVNDHLTAEYAFPRTPNIIPVGGVHIQPSTRLPEDIQRFMDEAEEGVILFSLGTYVPDNLMPNEYFDRYLGAFGRLRQRVLWKTRKTDFESLPPNVLTKSWMPQQGILNHPKCVLFVTHGGQHSQMESVHYGVPVIAIPQFYDQFRNAKYFEEKGVGLYLKEDEVTQESLYKAIQTVLGDKRYSQKMARLSAVFRDRPQSPAQSVVYWAEYVIRHGGAPHLRPVAANMPWHQRASLDVAAAFLLIIVAILGFMYCVIGFTFSFCKRAYTKPSDKLD